MRTRKSEEGCDVNPSRGPERTISSSRTTLTSLGSSDSSSSASTALSLSQESQPRCSWTTTFNDAWAARDVAGSGLI